MARGDGETNCYTGACAECGQVVAVTVAPFDEPDTLERAMQDRKEWRRYGLVLGSCLVKDVREGRVALSHAETCSRNRRKKREQKRGGLLAAAEA